MHYDYTSINYEMTSKELFAGTADGTIVRISTVETYASPISKQEFMDEEEGNINIKQRPVSSKIIPNETALSPLTHFNRNQVISFDATMDKRSLIEVLFTQINSG